MFGSEKGVSILWVIVMAVLFLVALFFAYGTTQKVSKLEEEKEKVLIELAKDKKLREEIWQEYKELSTKVGWADEQGTGKVAIQALADTIVRLKGKLGDYLPETEPTVQQVVLNLEKTYDGLTSQVSGRESDIKTARENESKAEENLQQEVSKKDENIAQLRREIQLKEEERTQEHERDFQQINSLRNQSEKMKEDLKNEQEEKRKEKNRFDNEILRLQRDLKEVSQRQKLVRERDLPDGVVLSYSEETKVGFIDIGLKDGIKKGVKFKVFEKAKGGEKNYKGWIRVVDAKKDMSKFGVIELYDSFNPIVPGDLVASDLYDREKQVVFVFLGILPGKYSNQEATRLLTELGVKVEEKVTPKTDFLAVGKKENEEAPDLESRQDFLLAREYSVQMLTPEQLRSYLEK